MPVSRYRHSATDGESYRHVVLYDDNYVNMPVNVQPPLFLTRCRLNNYVIELHYWTSRKDMHIGPRPR